MKIPEVYFRNNVANTLNLLEAMAVVGVKQIVFSSTCATYGIPSTIPIIESESQRPVNPYGKSKLFIERALYWQGLASNLRWVSLRYFNAAGADPDAELGEDHNPETHLIPLAIGNLLGQQPRLQVMGTDYPTPDGTAIRDYVHVTDLADAHVRALRYLQAGGKSAALNVGTGTWALGARGYKNSRTCYRRQSKCAQRTSPSWRSRRFGGSARPRSKGAGLAAQIFVSWRRLFRQRTSGIIRMTGCLGRPLG